MAGGPSALLYRHLMVHRRIRTVFVAEVVEPALYLLTMGFGIGGLVGSMPGMDPVPYAAYVAPALLATATMNSALNETTFGVFYRLHIDGMYRPIVAAPMRVQDIVVGELLWAVLRGLLACSGFLVIVGITGLIRSWWVVLVLPGAALIAFAFAAVGLAVTALMRRAQHLELIQVFMLPMFLCATTFYPLSVYPAHLRPVIAALPLYQSIEILRVTALGHPGPRLLLNALYLVVLGALSLWFAIRRMPALLLR